MNLERLNIQEYSLVNIRFGNFCLPVYVQQKTSKKLILTITFREEKWLGVFENRVLRNIFGLEKEEVTGDGKKLNTE
jgi:hypothetical protein